jgi:hypothetical protein
MCGAPLSRVVREYLLIEIVSYRFTASDLAAHMELSSPKTGIILF